MPCTDQDIEDTITGLLQARAVDATICPSEVARSLAPTDWRGLMPQVREVAFAMARQGRLVVRQKGHAVKPDAASLRGPIRLGSVSPRQNAG